MKSQPKICLILDNPLRDLDGLVLLSWHLARMGAEVWLVPMYEQAFDVRAIGADFVLMNYVRSNNLHHIISYMREGIKVGVLDTEGMAGKSAEEFADIISKSGGAKLVDMYCVWGKEQMQSVLDKSVVDKEKLRLTGCPRYDYCSSPWRESLKPPDIKSGYILINTNFPVTNSKFARNSSEEIKAMVNCGFTPDFAKDFVNDAHKTHLAIIDLMNTLTTRFPNEHFVLRPHPFESPDPYKRNVKAENFEVRQEGTSIEWLNHAKALIHLNCLTSIEASAFGVDAMSPDWLNTPTLLVPLSSSLSINFDNEESFITYLQNKLNAQENKSTVDKSAIEHYLLADGKAAERVAGFVVEELKHEHRNTTLPSLPLRFCLVNFLRLFLGYRLYTFLMDKISQSRDSRRKENKLFSAEQVLDIIQRIEKATNSERKTLVFAMDKRKLKYNRLASLQSVCLTRDV